MNPKSITLECPVKDCTNKWTYTPTGSEQGVCGMGAGIDLCPSCTEQGYKVYIHPIDNLFHLSQHGTELAVYDTDQAYQSTSPIRIISTLGDL